MLNPDRHGHIKLFKKKHITTITILFIIIAALSISLPGAFSSSPNYPDGQRYTFNGILLHDMVRDGGLFHPYEYNVKFYAHYPAANLPYGPPFYALVFAVAFSIFGISFSVARCVVAFYTVCAALICWHLVHKITKNYWLSILAVAAFLCNPLTGICARDPGPELAVAFHSFLAIYFFYNYVEYEKKYFAVYTALALGLGYLIKPYIVPLGMVLPFYTIIRRKWHVLYKTETCLAFFSVIILTVPYSILTFKYSTEGLGIKTLPPINWSLIVGYPELLMQQIPTLTLAATLGFVVGLYHKNRLTWLCLIWALCWYVFHTFYFGYYIGWRYLFSVMLSMLVPFAMVSYEATSFLKRVRLDKPLIGLLLFWFSYTALSTPMFYVQGYEEAGKYVAQNPRGKSVLYYGNYDGSFMMGIRRNVSEGGPYALRGDRQLATRLWWGELKDNLSIKSPNEIIEFLNKYHTGYVVVEHGMPTAVKFREYINLMAALRDNNYFDEVARFPIRTNYKPLGSEVVIYKFNFNEKMSTSEILTIPVPTLQKDLKIPF